MGATVGTGAGERTRASEMRRRSQVRESVSVSASQWNKRKQIGMQFGCANLVFLGYFELKALHGVQKVLEAVRDIGKDELSELLDFVLPERYVVDDTHLLVMKINTLWRSKIWILTLRMVLLPESPEPRRSTLTSVSICFFACSHRRSAMTKLRRRI